jgi:hypothetical protein
MATLTLKPKAANAPPEWKSEEYHGKQMHVCARLRAHENAALTGHGHQWDFTVKITEKDGGPTTPASATADSDPDLAYSTQAIAEDMGFLRGRELIGGD